MKRARPQAPPLPPGSIIRRNGREIEMVVLRKGWEPRSPEDRPRMLIRSEGQRFNQRRCLVPASDFRVAYDGKRYKVSLHTGDWFYLAGIWRPATECWPESYAVLTTAANPDLAPYHGRQVAVIRREDRMLWLDHAVPENELLEPLPARSFDVECVTRTPESQSAFAFRSRDLTEL